MRRFTDGITSNKLYLQVGLKQSISKRDIAPLLRSIEVCLKASTHQTQGHTFFSSDSFCEPHLETYLSYIKGLKTNSLTTNTNLSSINLPIGSYLCHKPDPSVLLIAHNPSELARVNSILLDHQPKYWESLGSTVHIDIVKENENFNDLIRTLYDALPIESFDNLLLNGFPFHELSLRDLCLTYKVGSDLVFSDALYREMYRRLNSFNLLILIKLLIEDKIGNNCHIMSFYTTSLIFLFFCRQTSRKVNYLEQLGPTLSYFNSQNTSYFRVFSSPVAQVQLTTLESYQTLQDIELGPCTRKSIQEMMCARTSGQGGSHVYSPEGNKGSKEKVLFEEWYEEQKQLGRCVLTAFSSSSDESDSQLITVKNENIPIDHLNSCVFKDQLDWLLSLVSFIRNYENNACLCIRLHPRLAADKRGLLASPLLESTLSALNKAVDGCKSIFIIEPADQVSSYAVGLKSDLILNGWSTIGLEFAMMGKRVNNAFYNTNKGGAAVYSVQIGLPPLM